jgi:nucleoside-diphosphate-sugar epimerase
VYGPGVKGNLQRLLGLVRRGVPLPFRSIRNRRSLVSVHNLVSFLERCAVDARAAGQTFLIADPEPISTAQLVTNLAAGLGRRPRLVPVPALALRVGAALTGRADLLDRLIGSMEIDARPSYVRLDWEPVVDTAAGLRAMAASYAAQAD